MASTLYVVATPIGNLEDITLRAVRILNQVDIIAAEDTRHTLQLLQHLGIHKPLLSLHEHNEIKRIEEIQALLEQDKEIALVSDAGTPCISDPGAKLVQALRAKGFTICPIPGPSAVIAALSATGLTENGFSFIGFLPVKGKERKEKLKEIQQCSQTVVLYESPHKLQKTLMDLDAQCQNPLITIARELTKVYEECITDTAKNLLAAFPQPRGEFVLLLPPSEKEEKAPDLSSGRALMKDCFEQGLGHKQAAEQVSLQIGISKKQAYELGMKFFHK